MNRAISLLRRFSSNNVTHENLNILKKEIKCKFKSIGMLELDTLINNYLNVNLNKIDKDKIKLLYNLMDIDSTNLLKLFYYYSNKQNNNIDKLSHYLNNRDEKEVKDTLNMIVDILNHNKSLSSQ